MKQYFITMIIIYNCSPIHLLMTLDYFQTLGIISKVVWCSCKIMQYFFKWLGLKGQGLKGQGSVVGMHLLKHPPCCFGGDYIIPYFPYWFVRFSVLFAWTNT